MQKNEYYKLPEIYKTELQELDTLIFENNEMQRDSFIVINLFRGNYQLALSGMSTKEPYAYHEFEYIIMNRIHDTSDCPRYNYVITQEDGNYGEGTDEFEMSCNSSIIGILVGVKNCWEATYDGAPKDYSPIINWYSEEYFNLIQSHETIVVDGYEYNNILEYSSDSGIRTIYYDYKKGVVSYIDSEDKTWIRIN